MALNDRTALNYDAIPNELKAFPHWVVWRAEQRDGRVTKVPLRVADGHNASIIEPAHWADFDSAVAVANRYPDRVSGIGFVLTENDPFVCIDLDDPFKHIDPSDVEGIAFAHEVRADQHRLAERFDSYCEASPSGSGAHIWLKGSAASCRNGSYEMYSSGRFMTVTGNVHGEQKPIKGEPHQQAGIDWLYGQLSVSRAKTTDDGHDEPQKLSDADVIALVERDPVCAALARGDRTMWAQQKVENSGANADVSQSVSDLALMNRIAHFSRNRQQTERLFSISAAYRPEKRGAYVTRTVAAAFDKVRPNVTVDLSRQVAAAQGVAVAGPHSVTLNLGDLLEHAKTHPAPQFTTDRLTPVGEVTMISANGGVGKTMLASQWAMSIAANREFFGNRTQLSPVLFVSAEDRKGPMAHRVRAIAAHMGLSERNAYTESVFRNFNFWEVTASPSLWVEDRSNTAGVPTRLMDELEARIVATGAKQVFIDNASSVFCANHNDNVQVTAFITHLRVLAERLGCNIALLAHVSAESANGVSRKTYYGSTAWHNAVRSRIFMELVPAKDGVPEHVRFAHEKSNYGRLAAPFKMLRDEQTGVLRLLSESQIEHAEDQNDTAFRDQLFNDVCEAAVSGKAVSCSTQGPSTFYHNLSALHPKRYRRDDRSMKARTRTALDRLEVDGRIVKRSASTDKGRYRDEWVPSPEFGKLGSLAGRGSPNSPNSPEFANCGITP